MVEPKSNLILTEIKALQEATCKLSAKRLGTKSEPEPVMPEHKSDLELAITEQKSDLEPVMPEPKSDLELVMLGKS